VWLWLHSAPEKEVIKLKRGRIEKSIRPLHLEEKMREIILIGVYWLHSIATVVWIGGIAFILFIAIPSARQVLGLEAAKLMVDISKRFNPIANCSIVILIITGVILTGFNKQYSGISNFGNNWYFGLLVKHLLVIGMVIIHFYRSLRLAPNIAKAEANKKVVLQKLSLNLVKFNFCLGLVVLLLSGVISKLN
jgi:uncharacterized membrane protein